MLTTSPSSVVPPFDLGAVLTAHDPYAALDAVREETEVARSDLGLHVMTYDRCHELLRDDRFHQGVPQMLDQAGITDPVVRRQWLTAMLGSPRADHDRMRRLLSPSFTPRAIASLRTYVAELTERSPAVGADDTPVAARSGAGPTVVEVMDDLAVGIPPAVFCRMIGAPETDSPLIGRLSRQVLDIFTRRPELASSIEAGTHELMDYVHGFVRDRRTSPREGDLISNLLLAEEDGERLSTDEMVTLVIEVLEASTDNTSSQLALVLHAAAQGPDRWAALRADPTLVPGFVEEASRLWPRIMCIGRVADKDLMLRDVTVPAGTVTFASVPSAHRDPAAHPDPLRFDPTRADRAANLNYGSGPHYCLGAALARMEMCGTVEVLARRWRHIEPAGPIEVDVSVGVVTVTSLPLAVTPA